MIQSKIVTDRFDRPLRGAMNPSSQAQGTTPGSFARAADIGGPLMFSSPDTPGMPQPSSYTAWDFLPPGHSRSASPQTASSADGSLAVTQLEHARLGTITDQMKRVAMRDLKGFCAILLDDTIRKPICRLGFNTSQKYLGLIDQQKHEERIPIADIDDIYNYADQLKATVGFYEHPVSGSTPATEA